MESLITNLTTTEQKTLGVIEKVLDLWLFFLNLHSVVFVKISGQCAERENINKSG